MATLQTANLIATEATSTFGRSFIEAVIPTSLGIVATASRQPPATEADLQLVAEAIRFLHAMAARAIPSQLNLYFAMYLRLLVETLRDPAPPVTSAEYSHKLHHLSLQMLTSIGTQYTQPFKQVVISNPSLKARLENAVRAKAAGASGAQNAQSQVETKKPTIQLKMDFSSFAK